MTQIVFLFHCKDDLVGVIVFHVQLDDNDMLLSYKTTLFKIGDLRNVLMSIKRYANHR